MGESADAPCLVAPPFSHTQQQGCVTGRDMSPDTPNSPRFQDAPLRWKPVVVHELEVWWVECVGKVVAPGSPEGTVTCAPAQYTRASLTLASPQPHVQPKPTGALHVLQ